MTNAWKAATALMVLVLVVLGATSVPAAIQNWFDGTEGDEGVEPSGSVHGGSHPSRQCDHPQARHTEEYLLVADARETVRIDVGAGKLVVQGRDGLEGVEVTATECASSEEYLADMELTVGEADNAVVVEAEYANVGGWRSGNIAYIDVLVVVPEGHPVTVNDASGSIVVAGTGDLRIDDASGSITVGGSLGSVWIDDSSGNVTISDVLGNLALNDGSGSIGIRGIAGDVRIDDISGSIQADEVGGNVHVEDGGSGSLRVSRVGGSVNIDDTGSGSVRVEEVRGDLIVKDRGSGSIKYTAVGGRVEVPSRGR